MINVATQKLPKEAINELLNRLTDDRWVLGDAVIEFEEKFAKYIGTEYAVSICNGTMGLLAVYEALGIRKRTLITTTYTFIATASVATFLGAKVDFVDVLYDNACLNPEEVVKKVWKKNDYIVTVVHIFGYPVRIDEIIDNVTVPIVEDCAQAHGAIYKNKKVGSFGDAAVFSFYPSKNMTVAGDGGMIVTNDEKLYRKLLMLRDNGRISKYTHKIAGLNLRLNTINAAIGLVELKYLDEWNEIRRTHVTNYYRLLKNLKDYIELGPLPSKISIPVYNTYPIKVKKVEHRGILGAWLKSKGINVAVYYPLPLHKQPLYEKCFTNKKYPVAEDWSKRVINLPCHQFLSSSDIKYVANSIIEFFEKEIYKDKYWKQKGIIWEQSLK